MFSFFCIQRRIETVEGGAQPEPELRVSHRRSVSVRQRAGSEGENHVEAEEGMRLLLESPFPWVWKHV